MPWFPEIANPAFCETLNLRRIILDRQTPPSSVGSTRQRVLEPGSSEFISALAAGNNSKKILHIGCGLSTIALAAAAKATGGYLFCVESDRGKQAIVGRYIVELGLSNFVEFIVQNPSTFIPQHEGFDFVLFTGSPQNYIAHFDVVKFTPAGIAVAYNALDTSTNEYIKHVRQQPGMDSSTLPVGRGIEVSKIISWDAFKTGKQVYCVKSSPELSNEVMTDVVLPGWDADTSSFGNDDKSWCGSPLCCIPGEEPRFFCSNSSTSLESDGIHHGLIQAATDGVDEPQSPVGTSFGEDSGGATDVNTAGEGIRVHFTNTDFLTEIKFQAPDQFMLLSDITMALNEANVSVQEAKISTTNNQVDDVFYVVDGNTKNILDKNQQEFVKTKILQKVFSRKNLNQ